MRCTAPLRHLVVSVVAVLVVASCGSSDTTAGPTATVPTSPDLTPVPTEPDGGPTPTATPTPTPTATPTPTPTATPTPSPLDCVATVGDRPALAQLLFSLAEPSEFEAAVDLAIAGELGGVALLRSPSAADVARLQRSEEAASGLGLIVASDEEGGRVQRLDLVLGPLPSALTLASRPLDEIAALFEAYGEGMVDLGVDVAFAPVVDVGGGPGIGDRSFSSDPASVVRNALAVIEGYLAAGVTPVIKHFPGHGSASGDTHLGFARTAPLDELRVRDLIPFVELAGPEVWVMVGHLSVPGLTGDLPASLSPDAVDGLLRDELGFEGVVITDALGMGAISRQWSPGEAARLALVAGIDVVLVNSPAQVPDVLDHLTVAVSDGSLPRARVDESLLRMLDHRGLDACEASRRLGSPP